jgi:hypothetical protein
MADRAFLERLSRELTDQGKLIEAGFVAMRRACDLHDAPADQLREMRMAFFAGAQHLFSSIMSILEPGAEPTEADLQRMDLIRTELDEWRAKLADLVKPTPTKPGLGDAPIEQQYREQMRSMAEYIDRYFNFPDQGHDRKTGFVLMTFAFGDDKGRCNYISNARRENVIVALKEQLARFEGRSPDVTGHA